MNKLELQKTANEIRKGIVTSVHAAKAGHPGGSLSCADIMTYLYFEEMNIDPKNPKKEDRDRFVLSKGHCAPALYSTLAQRGYFPVEELTTLRKLGSHLQGHPCMQHTPGVDMSSGSLGQGISVAVGMALSAASAPLISWLMLFLTAGSDFDFYRWYKLINGWGIQLCNFINPDASASALDIDEVLLMIPVSAAPAIVFVFAYTIGRKNA